MTTVFRIEYDGESIVEPNLLLMGFGYSIGLYLTQSWEVGLVAFAVVVGVYPSLRAAVQETWAKRRRVVESLPPSDLEAQYEAAKAPEAAAPVSANEYVALAEA